VCALIDRALDRETLTDGRKNRSRRERVDLSAFITEDPSDTLREAIDDEPVTMQS
jgi:hypothetical protein